MSISAIATDSCPRLYKNATSYSLQQLIETYGAQVLKFRFQSSFTVGEMSPLHYTIIRLDDPDLAAQLVELGAPVDEAHPLLGGTSLHLAALMLGTSCRSDRLFRRLLPYVHNVNAQDYRGYTPLHLVALNIPSCRAWKVADLLLKKEANLDVQAANGVTAREMIKHRSLGCCRSSKVWETFLSDYRRLCFRSEPIPEEA